MGKGSEGRVVEPHDRRRKKKARDKRHGRLTPSQLQEISRKMQSTSPPVSFMRNSAELEGEFFTSELDAVNIIIDPNPPPCLVVDQAMAVRSDFITSLMSDSRNVSPTSAEPNESEIPSALQVIGTTSSEHRRGHNHGKVMKKCYKCNRRQYVSPDELKPVCSSCGGRLFDLVKKLSARKRSAI